MQQLCLSFTKSWTILNLIILWLNLQCAKKSRLQEVNLVDSNSFLSWWKVVHFDPQERLEYEGLSVPVSLYCGLFHCSSVVTDHSMQNALFFFFAFLHPFCIENFYAIIISLFFFWQANKKVLVIHCKTNQALAVLGDQVLWYFPYFFY